VPGQLGMYFDDDENEVVRFMVDVADYNSGLDGIEKWMRKKIK
jgi:hypothetical protein